MYSKKGVGWILFGLLLCTRLIGINWGIPYFFHPDENNMARAVSQFGVDNLNPHFFAYNQFPLYLALLILRTIRVSNNFSNSVLVLRLISVFFSICGFFIFEKILEKINLTEKYIEIGKILYITCPGLIQLSHYGTTESLLIFVFLSVIFFSLEILNNFSIWNIVGCGIVTGIGLGSKISSAFFCLPYLLSFVIYFFENKKEIFRIVAFGFFYVYLTLAFFFISSPYSFIESKDFSSAIKYETDVANGKMKVFYTNQFLDSTPYAFQISRIFPYTLNPVIFFCSLIGLILIAKRIAFSKKFNIFIIFGSMLLYFGYFGQVYTKWTRFMSPIFPLLLISSVYFIGWLEKRSKSIYLFVNYSNFLFFLIFFSIYTKPDIRVVASKWISSNIPENSVVLSEGGNVVDIPVTLSNIKIKNLDFFNLETNTEIQKELIDWIYKSDYILIPSRRIFANQKGRDFPVSEKYYKDLFSGKLGFSQIKEFRSIALDDEMAEETWTVFDHPAIRVFWKTEKFDYEYYRDLILGET